MDESSLPHDKCPEAVRENFPSGVLRRDRHPLEGRPAKTGLPSLVQRYREVLQTFRTCEDQLVAGMKWKA